MCSASADSFPHVVWEHTGQEIGFELFLGGPGGVRIASWVVKVVCCNRVDGVAVNEVDDENCLELAAGLGVVGVANETGAVLLVSMLVLGVGVATREVARRHDLAWVRIPSMPP